MNLIYILLLIICVIVICILCYMFIKKDKEINNNIKNQIKEENNLMIQEETKSYFPSIQIIENNDIVPL